MRISEKQLLMLLDIAKDTCEIPAPVGGYTPQLRVQLINEIINQQSDDLQDVDPNNQN